MQPRNLINFPIGLLRINIGSFGAEDKSEEQELCHGGLQSSPGTCHAHGCSVASVLPRLFEKNGVPTAVLRDPVGSGPKGRAEPGQERGWLWRTWLCQALSCGQLASQAGKTHPHACARSPRLGTFSHRWLEGPTAPNKCCN